MTLTLSEMNPTGRFSDRSEDYVRFRPSYPAAAIDHVLSGLPPARRLKVADIGAGTGISARLLADRGCRVRAIEPNAVMRAAAEPHSLVDWQDGTAEATGLENGAVDLVQCAQAFHWFREEEALREFRRILKPQGRLVLMWNSRNVHDPLTAEYSRAMLDVAGEVAADGTMKAGAGSSQTAWFSEFELREFDNAQKLTRDGLIGRAMSASYVPRTGPLQEKLITRLEKLHDQHANPDGLVRLRYVTRVYTASSHR
ncbi:MAG: class I SAM-dependent methyltransferase [Planctomycetaceae bacterium]|nr:class I SAM-dependent methyltransferase [Planctomycetaceae bacterium]